MSTNKLINPKEVAQYLQLSTATVLRWLISGKIRGSKVGGRWKTTIKDIEDLLSKCSNTVLPLDTPVHADTLEIIERDNNNGLVTYGQVKHLISRIRSAEQVIVLLSRFENHARALEIASAYFGQYLIVKEIADHDRGD
jgi:excisionase family DNA binding protein